MEKVPFTGSQRLRKNFFEVGGIEKFFHFSILFFFSSANKFHFQLSYRCCGRGTYYVCGWSAANNSKIHTQVLDTQILGKYDEPFQLELTAHILDFLDKGNRVVS